MALKKLLGVALLISGLAATAFAVPTGQNTHIDVGTDMHVPGVGFKHDGGINPKFGPSPKMDGVTVKRNEDENALHLGPGPKVDVAEVKRDEDENALHLGPGPKAPSGGLPCMNGDDAKCDDLLVSASTEAAKRDDDHLPLEGGHYWVVREDAELVPVYYPSEKGSPIGHDPLGKAKREDDVSVPDYPFPKGSPLNHEPVGNAKREDDKPVPIDIPDSVGKVKREDDKPVPVDIPDSVGKAKREDDKPVPIDIPDSVGKAKRQDDGCTTTTIIEYGSQDYITSTITDCPSPTSTCVPCEGCGVSQCSGVEY